MKKTTIILVTILSLIIFILSCSEERNKHHKSESLNNKIIKENKSKNDNIALYKTARYYSDIFKLKKIIDLQTTKESLIGRIESLILLKNRNRIIIFDSKSSKILLFDLNGKFINNIGKKGKGPGEFFKPGPITFGSNEIIVYSKNGRILFYGLDGSFIKEINLRKNKWNFLANRMTTLGRDLYVYSRSKYYSIGLDGNRHMVFRISNFSDFDHSYGEPQETILWGAGDITTFKNKIIYTGIFNGKLYQIMPKNHKVVLFANLGQLYDVSKAKESYNPIMYLVKHIKELDAIERIAVIKGMIFVYRTQANLSIIDSNGTIINKNIQYDINKPEGFEGNALRLACEFYDDGIILASTKFENDKNGYFPNPSLIFYTLK